MAEPVLEARALCKSFGALRATRTVSLELRPGEIHALIGPNGAGKSTLIGQIAGALAPDSGSIHVDGHDVTRLGTVERSRRGLARSFQVSAVVPDFSVLQNLVLAVQGRRRRSRRVWRRWDHDRNELAEARQVAARCGLAEATLERTAAVLAHGERRRLELAMALALRPRVLLLDEPLAGMGGEGAADMTALLASLKREAPILLVEHDMDAVFALADRVSVLVGGAVIASGTVEAIRADARVREAYLG